MDNRENSAENSAEKLPMPLGQALERETLKPETLLFWCGISTDELDDNFAEFDPVESEEALELSALRIAEILDTIVYHATEQALDDLGKDYLNRVAVVVMNAVVLEQRAITRHRQKAADHNCATENCPFGDNKWDYDYEPNSAIQVRVESANFTPRADLFGSEWE